MSRSERLLHLMDLLRRHRYPLPGSYIAAELGISLRTLYRDMATLQGQGAQIEGEPGLGYILRPGFTLPPLMFTEEELEALILGSRWVAKRTDIRLQKAALNALGKISSILPPHLRHELDTSTLLVGPSDESIPISIKLEDIRQVIRREHKIEILYRDLKDHETRRIIWPFALAFFDRVRVLTAWCEVRQAFRHFRLDRIKNLTILESRYPRRRQVLLKEWREQEGIPPS